MLALTAKWNCRKGLTKKARFMFAFTAKHVSMNICMGLKKASRFGFTAKHVSMQLSQGPEKRAFHVGFYGKYKVI